MKRIAAIAAVLLGLLSGGAAHALGPVGTMPSEPEGVGTAMVSGGILQREIRLVPRKPEYSAIKVRQNHVYVQASEAAYGWEVGGRIGLADFSDGEQYSVGYKPFAGILVKGSVYGDRVSDIGLTAALRADVFSPSRVANVTIAPGQQANVRVKDFWDIESTLSAHRRFDRLTVYGGPSLRYVEAKVFRTVDVPVGVESNSKSYYRSKTLIGIVGGLSWQQGDYRFGFEAAAASGTLSAGFEVAVGF